MVRLSLFVLMVMVIGVLDYLTGYDVSLSAFYLIPVAGASWVLGGRAGVFIAFLTAATYMISDHSSGHIYAHPFSLLWNGFNRLALGIGTALACGALRRHVAQQKTLIFDLRRALLSLNELSAKIPVCPLCSRVRDDDRYREEVQAYVAAQDDPRAVGEPCPECVALRREALATPIAAGA